MLKTNTYEKTKTEKEKIIVSLGNIQKAGGGDTKYYNTDLGNPR